MNHSDVVIVGGGPAALSIARSYRDAGGDGSVTIVSREPHPPYDRPPLTKEFLRGETSADQLPIEHADWYEANGVDLRLSTEATSLDVSTRTISLSNGSEITYDTCILATGSSPSLPPVPGADDPEIHVVRTLEDSRRLISKAERVRSEGGSFVVLGSGFIGCEVAASLAMRGVGVKVVTLEEAPQMERLGPDAAREISGWLRDIGVELVTGAEVKKIEHDGNFEILYGDDKHISGDGLVIGAGVSPNTALAEAAGLEVEGGIVCDASMRTSDPNILAAGDVALAFNEAAARHLKVEHWGDALGQGKVCGETLAGRGSSWSDVPGFWSTVGGRTLKYAAWGDGWDEARFVGDASAFTVWYGLNDVCVGVLSFRRDDDYESGRALIERGARLPV